MNKFSLITRVFFLPTVLYLICAKAAIAQEGNTIELTANEKVAIQRLGAVKDTLQVKRWPQMRDLTLILWYNRAPNQPGWALGNNDDGDYDLTLAVVRRSTGTVLIRRDIKNAFTSDADHLDGVWIDTANYKLAAGVMAFGVRSSRSHHGGVETFEEFLDLYAIEQSSLRNVGRIKMISEASDKGCGHTHTIHRKLTVVPKRRGQGYANLVVREHSYDSEGTIAGEDCKTLVSRDERSVVLRYHGRGYAIPQDLAE